MVEPTKGDQVVGICGPALGPGNPMMGLQPVATGATIGRASSIPEEDEAAKFGRDDPGGMSHCQRLIIFDGDLLDGSITEDLFNDGYPCRDT